MAIPVVYSAHHASHDFGEYSDRVSLSTEQRIRFSDYGTADSIPMNGIVSLVAKRSRGIIDLNRSPDNPNRFAENDFAKPVPNSIWLPGQTPTVQERAQIEARHYKPYHARIAQAILEAETTDPLFVVAWDNTAHYEIGKDDRGNPTIMKPFILSNQGAEHRADSDGNQLTSCDPIFLKLLATKLRKQLRQHGLVSEIYLNLVFRGGYISEYYNTRRHRPDLQDIGLKHTNVQSFQVEYDASITHDPATLEPDMIKIAGIRESFEQAMTKSYAEYYSSHKHGTRPKSG